MTLQISFDRRNDPLSGALFLMTFGFNHDICSEFILVCFPGLKRSRCRQQLAWTHMEVGHVVRISYFMARPVEFELAQIAVHQDIMYYPT